MNPEVEKAEMLPKKEVSVFIESKPEFDAKVAELGDGYEVKVVSKDDFNSRGDIVAYCYEYQDPMDRGETVTDADDSMKSATTYRILVKKTVA
jgi:hypothetical protein